MRKVVFDGHRQCSGQGGQGNGIDRDGRRNGNGSEFFLVGKRPLGDEPDRCLVLKDIFGREVLVGRNQTVVDDECAFLPFVFIGCDAASCKCLFANRRDGGRDDYFLQVFAITECLMINTRDARGQFHALDGLVTLERACGTQPCALRDGKTGFDGFVSCDKNTVNP